MPQTSAAVARTVWNRRCEVWSSWRRVGSPAAFGLDARYGEGHPSKIEVLWTGIGLDSRVNVEIHEPYPREVRPGSSTVSRSTRAAG